MNKTSSDNRDVGGGEEKKLPVASKPALKLVTSSGEVALFVELFTLKYREYI